MKAQILKWTVSVLIVLVGLWLSVGSFSHLREQSQFRTWPAAEGTVIQASVDNSESNMPLIVYHFAVDGAEYVDTTTMGAPGFGGKRKRWEYARELLSHYPESTKVAIHYNPANPAESAIRTSVSFEVYTRLSFGVCLVLGGLLWMAVLLRRKESSD